MKPITVKDLRNLCLISLKNLGLKNREINNLTTRKTGGIEIDRLYLHYNSKLIVRLSFRRCNVVEYRDIDNNIFGTFQDTAYID